MEATAIGLLSRTPDNKTTEVEGVRRARGRLSVSHFEYLPVLKSGDMGSAMKCTVRTVLLSVVVAWVPLVLLVLLSRFIPGIIGGLILTVPIGVVGGFILLWRRYPKNAYLIGLVYVPVVGGTLLWGAFSILWRMGRVEF